jgi:hypothetical protein
MGTSDAVCECGVPAAGSTLITPNTAQMNAMIECGNMTTMPQGGACPTEDQQAEFDSLKAQHQAWTQNTCAEWVSAGLPGIPSEPIKGEGCNYCLGGGVVGCILCPKSCAANPTGTANAATASESAKVMPSSVLTHIAGMLVVLGVIQM